MHSKHTKKNTEHENRWTDEENDEKTGMTRTMNEQAIFFIQ